MALNGVKSAFQALNKESQALSKLAMSHKKITIALVTIGFLSAVIGILALTNPHFLTVAGEGFKSSSFGSYQWFNEVMKQYPIFLGVGAATLLVSGSAGSYLVYKGRTQKEPSVQDLTASESRISKHLQDPQTQQFLKDLNLITTDK